MIRRQGLKEMQILISRDTPNDMNCIVSLICRITSYFLLFYGILTETKDIVV